MSEEKPNLDQEENSVTMLDVLQEENQLEEDANAVLGASDDKNCTYAKGYIGRQALYACKTCSGKDTRAAVCLACSFHCHEGHELIELYTKRNFRCDCGNSKFGDKSCSLDPSKSESNPDNKYNQNFDGVYCTCARPYPDPENQDNDEMLQCVICEDWYHSKHLGSYENQPENFEEVVCWKCMKDNDFLWRYVPEYSAKKDTKKEKTDDEKDSSLDVLNVSETSCVMPKQVEMVAKDTCCYWNEGWRCALCKCEDCLKMYEEKNILFLLDPMDSVQAYEEAGKANQHETQYEKGMKALASLDHVQQLTAIEEYNVMKERLKEYLQKFADNKKVVREEDIAEFFTTMASRKRPKVTVPTFCR